MAESGVKHNKSNQINKFKTMNNDINDKTQAIQLFHHVACTKF